MVSDEALFLAFLRGESGPFEVLVRRHEAPLYRFLLRRATSAGQAEDLFQETWVGVLRGRHTYREGRPFRPWLYAIALNLARKAHGRPRPASLDTVDEAVQAEPGIGRAETSDRVQAAVQALPEAQREVFLLSEYDGLPYAEIAELLGRPLGTVKSQMHYAIKQLRAHLEPLWEGR
ncbi:MAG TPA: sigma-70 family RNA polymerase sigma factor [Planctomycetota bacterium]|nr:sigma-70 family RNA polymerase sigma factor [Planctomycetota bacterium]